MKFSIVTPSFNQGRFIRDCIESVCSQSWTDLEHIVVDACSTDETVDVLRSFPHLKWTSEKDQGMSDGINKGFLRATGDWVMWLNADDYLMPDTLSKVAEFAQKNEAADVIYGDCVFVDEAKTTIRRKREHRFDYSILLFYGCYIPSTSTFLRRKVIESGHLVSTDYCVCMDMEYYLRLARAGYRFEYLPEPLACFRWHETNTSTVQTQKRWQERVRIQRDFLQQSNRSWMGSSLVLALMRRYCRIKRAFLRSARHRSAS